MNQIIFADKLASVRVQRDDVDTIISFLNEELIKAQRSGKSRYVWRTFQSIAANGDYPQDPTPQYNALAIEIVIDMLRAGGYDVEVSDRSDRKTVTIIWDKLFYEKQRQVRRFDEFVSDEIVPPPSKIETDKNTSETQPLTWIQKWRAQRVADAGAIYDEEKAAHAK